MLKKNTGTPPLNDWFGLLFDKRFYNTDTKIIHKKPQIIAPPGTLLQPTEWIKINGSFTATEPHTHIYIGQFYEEGLEDFLMGYFFIDDVFVEAIEKEAEQFEPSKTYKIKGKVASIVMENIYFETDKYELLPESFVELDKLVHIMQNHPTMTINILGHTDSEGGADHNQILSENRAKAVSNYLVKKGIAEQRLSREGKGLSQPVADNSTASGRQKNRRVEFVTNTQDTVGEGVILADLAYVFSQEIEKNYPKLAAIGKDERQWNCDNFYQEYIPDSEIFKKHIQSFSKYKPADAYDFILQKTKNERITQIEINAQHPEFAAFVEGLLEKLFQQGYTHIGVEKLFKIDEIQSLGYPILEGGENFQQPIHGEIIRRALQLGFEIFDFAPTLEQGNKALKILRRQNYQLGDQDEKEAAYFWASALNINRILKTSPDAKILLLNSLVEEQSFGNHSTMPQWLKKFTGIDPLTIGQSVTDHPCLPTGQADFQKKHPLFSKMNISKPTVFLKNETPFRPMKIDFQNLPDRKAGNENSYFSTDIQIFHPKKIYTKNRPSYLAMNGKRKPHLLNIDKYKMTYPCLVLAYRKGEDVNKAIPVDVIELTDNQDVTALFLPNGSFEVVLRDQSKRKKLTVEVE